MTVIKVETFKGSGRNGLLDTLMQQFIAHKVAIQPGNVVLLTGKDAETYIKENP